MVRICNTCLESKDNLCFRQNRNKCKKCASKETSLKFKERSKNDASLIDYRIQYLKKYRKINKDTRDRNEYKREYEKNRLKDPKYKIEKNLRCRLYQAAKGSNRVNVLNLVGLNKQGLKQHLESLFKEGMNWDNYGINGWHIDHIKPCALFDFTNIEHQKQCFHYTNLQPLWAKENRLKSDKYNPIQPTQESSNDS